jgi:hypothetical protein
MRTWSSALRIEQATAHAYLDRLALLRLDISSAREFVNGTRSGDEARLRRLNVVLRIMDRMYGYDPAYNYAGPYEGKSIPGVSVLHSDIGDLTGVVVGGLFGLLDRTPPKLMSFVQDRLIDGADWAVQTKVNFSSLNSEEKRIVKQYWGYLKGAARGATRDHRDVALTSLLAGEVVSGEIARSLVDQYYVAPMQAELKWVVDQIRAPGWSGNGVPDYGADAYAQQAVQDLRKITRYRHAEAASTIFGIEQGQFVDQIAAVVLAGSNAKRISQIVNTFVRDAIIWATVVDVASDAIKFISYVRNVDGIIVSPRGGGVGGWLSATEPTSVRVSAEARSVGLRAPARMDGAIRLAIASAESTVAIYEATARDLEAAISSASPNAAELTLLDLKNQEFALGVGDARLSVPLLAVAEDARLHVPDYQADADTAMNGVPGVSGQRQIAMEAVTEWLQDTYSDSLRKVALEAVRTAIDQTVDGPRRMSELIVNVLGELAYPFLVVVGPPEPVEVLLGDSLSVCTSVTNLGAAMADSGQLTIGFADGDFECLGSRTLSLPPLATGESVQATWRLRATPPMSADPDTVMACVWFGADALDEQALSPALGVRVAMNPEFVGVGSGPGLGGASLRVFPNPAKGRVSFEFWSDRGEKATLSVIDVMGRRVRIFELDAAEPGMRRVFWNGKRTDGGPAPPGIYFTRLQCGSRMVVQRLVLVQ